MRITSDYFQFFTKNFLSTLYYMKIFALTQVFICLLTFINVGEKISLALSNIFFKSIDKSSKTIYKLESAIIQSKSLMMEG